MSKVIDYSSWDHIEISDDEDETHPNVDTACLFQYRHDARIQKMEKAAYDKKESEEELLRIELEKQNLEKKLQNADQVPIEELEELKLKQQDLEEQEKTFREKEEMLKKEEKLQPWNVDTLCKDKESKTVINKSKKKTLPEEELSEEDKLIRQDQFKQKYQKELQHFGMLKKSVDSKEFLKENLHLVCNATGDYLAKWCLDLQLEGKETLMEHVAYQSTVMQFILQLSRLNDKDPRDCVDVFFFRMNSSVSKDNYQQYVAAFTEELEEFKGRVRVLARKGIDAARKKMEEEERQKRLGPGGLDPLETFEQLPRELQECYESNDIQKLMETIKRMNPNDAEHYMKLCVDSGLWVNNAEQAKEEIGDEHEQENGDQI